MIAKRMRCKNCYYRGTDWKRYYLEDGEWYWCGKCSNGQRRTWRTYHLPREQRVHQVKWRSNE